MENSIKVVKIGGNVVENEEMLERFCKDFAGLQGRKILVHGGGVMASKLQESMGMVPKMVEGRRVTDSETLKVVTMTYAGWCNKHVVALLQEQGCNAIGLAGCDADIIRAKRRAPRKLSDGITEVDYGLVGDVRKESINRDMLLSLMDLDLVPVFCAINHDGQGGLLNTNADTVAASISASLNAELLYCFEKNGVLCNPNDCDSVIPELTPTLFRSLCEDGTIAGGMIPKIENSFRALEDGACSVVIRSSERLTETSGTRLRLD